MSTRTDQAVEPRPSTSRFLLLYVGVGVIALFARLLPVLRGGGLFGLGNYDDSVYMAASIGLVHGRLPYRDFLLLHPPGVVLALAPFAALGRLFGEPTGFALARLGWMVMGSVSAVLVSRILRPVGLFAAAAGGLCYALFYPAIYVELTTQLQGLGNFFLLASMLLVAKNLSGKPATSRAIVLAGALLGVSASTKIWGVVTVLLVVGWMFFAEGPRRAARLLAGAVLGAVAVCLPFFVVAPAAMWRMVVTAQLGRPWRPDPLLRLSDIAGLRLYESAGSLTRLLVVAMAAVVIVVVLAWRERRTRLAVVLFVGLVAFLVLSPSWFQHYAALSAPPLAVMVGSAAQLVVRWLRPGNHILSTVAGSAILLTLVAYAAPLTRTDFGRSFHGATLAGAVQPLSGCVVGDNPAALIEMNVIGRNLSRGCRLIVDLGGYSYVLPRTSGDAFPRAADPIWQQFALAQLRSGSAAIIVNYRAGDGFSRATDTVVRSWPVLGTSGSYRVRAPQP